MAAAVELKRDRSSEEFRQLAATAKDANHARGLLALPVRKRSPPASLNFGDVFAYTLARTSAEPLLFKGNDFSETDLPLVIWTTALKTRHGARQAVMGVARRFAVTALARRVCRV